MRTVLFTTFTCYTTGGLHSRQSRLAPLLARHGWRAVFGLAWGHRLNDPFEFRRYYPDLETVLMDGRTGTRTGRFLAIDRAIRRVRADIVIPSDMIDVFDVMLARKLDGFGPRFVCGLTGLHADYMALIETYAPIVDGAFGVSPLTARALVDLCALPPDRVDEIPTGIADRSRPRIEREGIEREGGPIRLGYIGRLVADKRPLDLAALTHLLSRRGVAHEIEVFGDGDLRSQLVATLGASAGTTVHLREPVPPALLYEDVYPRLDVALIFSPSEGNPNALLEAMANGVVPVCSDYAGRLEQGLIRDGETGLVFPIGDCEAAAQRIERLAGDEALRARLAQRARQEVLEHHSLDVMGERFAAMLDRAMSAAPRVGRVDLDRGKPASRLEALFGPRVAEAIRRAVRYRYPHTNHEEWPSTESVRGDRTEAMAAKLKAWLER